MLESWLSPDRLVAATSDPFQAVFAAVLLYAVKDVRSPASPHAAEARMFIQSEEFERICNWLEFKPDRWRDLALSKEPERAVAGTRVQDLPGWKPYMGNRTPDEYRELCRDRMRGHSRSDTKKRPCPGCGKGLYRGKCPSCAALEREAKRRQQGPALSGKRVHLHLLPKADQLDRTTNENP